MTAELPNEIELLTREEHSLALVSGLSPAPVSPNDLLHRVAGIIGRRHEPEQWDGERIIRVKQLLHPHAEKRRALAYRWQSTAHRPTRVLGSLAPLTTS